MKYQINIKTAERTLVDISDFKIEENKINFLFGESGIGKTLISKGIYGLLNSDDLSVEINAKSYDNYLKLEDTINIKQNGFFLFQEPSSHLNPLMTINEQISEGDLQNKIDDSFLLSHFSSTKDKIEEFTKLLDLYPKTHRPSGGEKQRVLLLMAFKKLIKTLSSGASGNLFFFDEPTGSLDNKLRDKFLDLLLLFFSKTKFTAVIITHDYSIISYLFKHYPSSKSAFYFSELYLENGKQHHRNFNPDEYLNWISDATAISSEISDKSIILNIDSNYSVFGMKMQIYQQEENSTPLILRKGELYYLKAGSGVGKSTLIGIIAGIIKADEISMRLNNFVINQNTKEDLWRKEIWGKLISIVSQNPDESLNQNSRVNQILDGLPLPGKKNNIRDLLADYFTNIDSEFLNKKIRYLSGGQKQRLNIMRGASLTTELLLMDEPLNGLDLSSIKKIVNIINVQIKNGKTVLITSHNEEIFEALIPKDNIYKLRRCN